MIIEGERLGVGICMLVPDVVLMENFRGVYDVFGYESYDLAF